YLSGSSYGLATCRCSDSHDVRFSFGEGVYCFLKALSVHLREFRDGVGANVPPQLLVLCLKGKIRDITLFRLRGGYPSGDQTHNGRADSDDGCGDAMNAADQRSPRKSSYRCARASRPPLEPMRSFSSHGRFVTLDQHPARPVQKLIYPACLW